MTNLKTDTREKIIHLATDLIEEKGYSGFSYQDIADVLDIKKASIHYHFPAKEDLGLAVFNAFRGEIDQYMEQTAFEKLSPAEKLAGYFQFHSECTLEGGDAPGTFVHVSCIGALTSEWNTLPETLRDKIEEFNRWHIKFISDILKEGIEKKEFIKVGNVEDQALMIIAATKGALLLAREKNSMETYHAISSQILRSTKC
jgi:TetR/AcrR family transcriptional repressor of nem operon